MIGIIFYALPWIVILNVASKYHLEPALVAAIIVKESSGNGCPPRYEPNWKYFLRIPYFANKAGTTVETERQGQMHSWGHMQIMGGTSRQLGFEGSFPELCLPENGIEYGCKYLRSRMDNTETTEQAVSAYNAGSVRYAPNGDFINQAYVDEIMEHYKVFKEVEGLLNYSVTI